MIHNRKKYFILLPIAFLLVIPIVIMLLWNHTLVVLFGIKTITYVQSLGLFLLSRLLFGRFGFGPRRKPPFGKSAWGEKMMNLSDDEKCRMKEEWKKRNEKTSGDVK